MSVARFNRGQITLHNPFVAQRPQLLQLRPAHTVTGISKMAERRFAGKLLVEGDQFARFTAAGMAKRRLNGRQFVRQQDALVIALQKVHAAPGRLATGCAVSESASACNATSPSAEPSCSTNGCASPSHSAASCVSCVCGHIFAHGKSSLQMLYTRHTDTLRAPEPDCEQEKFPPRKNIGA